MKRFIARFPLLLFLSALCVLAGELSSFRLQIWVGFAAALTLGLVGAHFGAQVLSLHANRHTAQGDIWMPWAKGFLVKLVLLGLYSGLFYACWGPACWVGMLSLAVGYLAFLASDTLEIYRIMVTPIRAKTE